MKNRKKINVIKKVGVSFLVAPFLAASPAFAEKTPAEQADYQACMSTKHQWLFLNFDYQNKNSTQAKQNSLLLMEKRLKGFDMIRIGSETLNELVKFGGTLNIPRNVVESMVCLEKFKRSHPEDENHGFECAQSCAVTVR